MPVAAIFAAIAAEGHRCTNTGREATLKSVWRVVKDIERGAPNGVPESVRRFVGEACRLSPGSTVLTRYVWRAFQEFCTTHGLSPVSRNRLPAFIRLAAPSVQTRLARHHADGFEFVGLALA